MPAKAGIHAPIARVVDEWVPAFAGTTILGLGVPTFAGDSRGRRYHIPAMTIFFTILLVLAMLAVLGVLGAGVVTMIRGGNPRLSNRLMQGRVAFQALALVLLALLMLMAGGR